MVVSFHGGSPFYGLATPILCESEEQPPLNLQLWSGHRLRASLIRNAKRVTLDDPQTGAASSEGYPVVEGKPIEDFVLDLTHARIADYQSRVGPREAD